MPDEPSPPGDPLEGLAAALNRVAAAVDAMSRDQQAAERRRNRRSIATLACAVIIALAAGVLTYVAITNRTVLDKINAVTGPVALDRQAAATAAILRSNQIEGDCRSRRQQARLPAPQDAPFPPAGITTRDLSKFLAPYTCVAQTPADIYPGRAGEPVKGTG